MRKSLVLAQAAVLVLSLVTLGGCGKGEKESGGGASQPAGGRVGVGLVLSVGGLGDKSFNDSAYEGLIRAEDDLGIKAVYGQP